jgi:hypothetical protein
LVQPKRDIGADYLGRSEEESILSRKIAGNGIMRLPFSVIASGVVYWEASSTNASLGRAPGKISISEITGMDISFRSG